MTKLGRYSFLFAVISYDKNSGKPEGYKHVIQCVQEDRCNESKQ